MSLPRLRLEKSSFTEGKWHITPEEARHLVTVRRCHTGSLVEGLLDGERIRLRLDCGGDSITAVEVSRESEAPPYPVLHLLLALLKSDQFDAALRFTAEIGVTKIHLLECERCVPKYFDARTPDKLVRWRKILDEATKQAGSTRPPLIEPPVRLEKLDYSLLPEAKYAALFSDRSVQLNGITINSPVAVAIGPEGDWSPVEASLLIEKGFQPISLGKRILRASTAVAAACSWFMLNGVKMAKSTGKHGDK